MAVGQGDRFHPAVDAQLAQQVLHMVAHRRLADAELGGDIPGVAASGQPAQDLDLPGREAPPVRDRC